MGPPSAPQPFYHFGENVLPKVLIGGLKYPEDTDYMFSTTGQPSSNVYVVSALPNSQSYSGNLLNNMLTSSGYISQ